MLHVHWSQMQMCWMNFWISLLSINCDKNVLLLSVLWMKWKRGRFWKKFIQICYQNSKKKNCMLDLPSFWFIDTFLREDPRDAICIYKTFFKVERMKEKIGFCISLNIFIVAITLLSMFIKHWCHPSVSFSKLNKTPQKTNEIKSKHFFLLSKIHFSFQLRPGEMLTILASRA